MGTSNGRPSSFRTAPSVGAHKQTRGQYLSVLPIGWESPAYCQPACRRLQNASRIEADSADWRKPQSTGVERASFWLVGLVTRSRAPQQHRKSRVLQFDSFAAHHLQVVDSKGLKSATHSVSRTADISRALRQSRVADVLCSRVRRGGVSRHAATHHRRASLHLIADDDPPISTRALKRRTSRKVLLVVAGLQGVAALFVKCGSAASRE